MFGISQQRFQLSNFSDIDLMNLLNKYVLSYEVLRQLKYPLPDIKKPSASLHQHQSYLPVSNKPNQVPSLNSSKAVSNSINPYKKSGSSRGSSLQTSDSEPDFDAPPFIKPNCARCGVQFILNYITGKYITNESCSHHWGKCRSSCLGSLWTCCNQAREVSGCTTTEKHVWNGVVPGSIVCYKNYVQTFRNTALHTNGNAIYGLDCEMCFTTHGLEITRITVVNVYGSVVYESFVKPDHDIVDYNTRFSGITPKHLRYERTTLRDVQRDLLSFITSNTILIGHGLENDLKALKIIHTKVIDTSVPLMSTSRQAQRRDYTLNRSGLQTCAMNELQREIQNGMHDSGDDARAAVDIVLQRLWNKICEKNIKKNRSRNQPLLHYGVQY